MNQVTIIGNLTRDPELKTTPNGISVCTFTVAVQRRFGEDKQADFIPVVTWRGLADNCGKYLAKGRTVAVSGSIQTRNYENSEGKRVYITEIVANDVQFLGKGEKNENEGSFEPMKESNFEPIDSESLPF